jgi:hypothetical protein
VVKCFDVSEEHIATIFRVAELVYLGAVEGKVHKTDLKYPFP